jgi:hypothetical protein
MSRTIPLLFLLLGCASAASKPPASVAMKVGFEVSEAGWGPITPTTVVSSTNLHALFPDYEVKADRSNFDILKEGQTVAKVITQDGDATRVFNVAALTPLAQGPSAAWVVGGRFGDITDLTDCECWGAQPVCYKPGSHLAVMLEAQCEGNLAAPLDPGLAAMKIERVIWNLVPLAPTT